MDYATYQEIAKPAKAISITQIVVGASGAPTSYTVFKYGIIGLTKHIAVDYVSFNI